MLRKISFSNFADMAKTISTSSLAIPDDFDIEIDPINKTILCGDYLSLLSYDNDEVLASVDYLKKAISHVRRR